MAVSVLIIILVTIFCYTPTLSQDTCGYIGNTNETELTPSRARMLFLDMENPATTSGNITGFRVCYYEPEGFDKSITEKVYRTLYAVYRKTSSDNGSSESYVRVSESFNAAVYTEDLPRVGPRDIPILRIPGFNCYDDVLDVAKDSVAFATIEKGDILGACIFDPTDFSVVERLQLDVVGIESGHSLMQTSSDDCIETLVSPLVIPVDQLTVVTSRKLHIYANISKCVGNKS